MPDADQMEVDEAKAEEQDEDSEPGAATPDRSDDVTEDEEGPAPEESSMSVRSASKSVTLEDVGPPPPRRELPFGRPPSTRNTRSQQQPIPPGEDDETEDEEL
jgi:hypothetical protein